MSQFPSPKEVERIKKMYPKGTRIQIERMQDPYPPIESGTKGTVDHVDDAGTLHCIFDNGRTLGVVTDADIFHVIDRLNVPIAERYAYLLGSAIDGNKRLHRVQEVAAFICKHGQYGDVRITTMEGKELLDTFGIYINKICGGVGKVLQ